MKEYDELLKKQNGCCAICEKPASESKKRLAVDHDHHTGEIRGLLCAYCNHRLIGRHRNPELMRRIADYLEQGTGKFVPEEFKKGPRKKRPIKRKARKT